MTAHLVRVRSRLAIHAHRKVRGLLDGEYPSVQTGRGIDFADLREYVPGDDVKDLDWKASARTGTLLIKRFVAERKHTVLLAVSTGRSMAAQNDLEHSKRDLAVFCAGVIGQLATRHGDLVSLAHGDADGQHLRPPGGGDLHLEQLLGAVHDATLPDAPASDIVAVLRYVARVVKRQSILVVISDEPVVGDETVALLRRLSVQHEVLFLTIGDVNPTREDQPSPSGADTRRRRPRGVVDIDTGAAVPAWLRGDAQLAREWTTQVILETGETKRRLDSLGIAHERVHDDASAVRAVFRLLQRHKSARRR